MCTSECLKSAGYKRLRWGCALLLLHTAVMAAGPDPAGLVLYLPFEDATNPVDASADPTSVVVHGALASAQGQLGTKGLEFDGNPANRIEVLHAPKLEGMSALTIEAWALPRNMASHEGMSIVSKRIANQNADAYNLFIWTGQLVEARVNAGGAIRSTTALQNNNWYHIAYVFDAQAGAGQKTKLYINGVLENTGDHTASVALGSNGGGAPVWIGELDAARGFPWDGVLDEIGIWNIALTEADIHQLMVQSKARMLRRGVAWDPTPADGAEDVLHTTDLAWSPGEYAVTHNVYFGTSREDVNAADPAVQIAEGLARDASSVELADLDFGRTYYWRIDEVNGAPDFAVLEGNVWSFTVEPLAYPVANVIATTNGISQDGAEPEKTVDGSGLDADDRHSTTASDMWLADAPEDEPLWIRYDLGKVYKLHEMLVWNYNVQFELLLGFGLKDVAIEYSVDGQEWTMLGNVEFNQATARPTYAANTTVVFGGVPARYVRLIANSTFGGGGQFGLGEVRFLFIPAQASRPHPADGATGVAPDMALSWRQGRDAAVSELYLGTEPESLALLETVSQSVYPPAGLSFGTTYYWRIDAVGDVVWSSDLWSFSTVEYQLIEGFESYTDDIDAGEAIFDTWLDGWVNETGSTVGHLQAPFAEQTIVRSGRQSMPLFYDNTESPFYSETSRTFASSQDWTVHGADTLRLFVAGVGTAFYEADDGTIILTGAGRDIWDNADEFRYAYRSLSGNGSMTVRVLSNGVGTNLWAKGGVMIRQSLDAGAINVMGAVTGGEGNGGTFQWRSEANGSSVSDRTLTGIVPPYWVRLTREGNTFTVEMSADGEQWLQQGANPVTIAMQDPVLIGLAVTSHASGELRTFEFDSVSTTGNVTGNWQVAAVGVEQGEGNDPAPLYVALEDANGQTATVTHPSLVVRGDWNEWAIPYSDLAGVNLSRVRTMTIGVGSRTSPTAGGAGVVYIDDIAFGRPAAAE